MKPLCLFLVAVLLACASPGNPRPAAAGSNNSSGSCAGENVWGVTDGMSYFQVEGNVVFVDSHGLMQPVDKLAIFGGRYMGESFHGTLREVRNEADGEGEFSFQAGVPHSIYRRCIAGQWEHEDVYLTAHYLFRVDGCDDFVLEVSKDWKPRTVKMVCRGITSNAG